MSAARRAAAEIVALYAARERALCAGDVARALRFERADVAGLTLRASGRCGPYRFGQADALVELVEVEDRADRGQFQQACCHR